MYKWIFFFGLFYVIRAETYRVSSLRNANNWDRNMENMGYYFGTGKRINGYPVFKTNIYDKMMFVSETGHWRIGDVLAENPHYFRSQRKAKMDTPPVSGWMYYNHKLKLWVNDRQLLVQKKIGTEAKEGFELVPGFAIGRLTAGQFEYPSLNGWMTPEKAANICEEDLMCAGFTYKGSLIMEKEYEIYFFKLTVNLEEDEDSWKWIYYQVKRKFSTFPGVFTNVKNAKNKKRWRNNKIKIPDLVDVVSAEKKCLSLTEKCVGFIQTINKSEAVLMDYIDMDTFVESHNKITKVKLERAKVKLERINDEYKIDGSSSWDNLKRCCPKDEKVNTEKLLEEINDTVKRISCDIPKEEFLEKYVKRRQTVVLVNCSTDWYAQKHWTIDTFLNEGGWSAAFEINNKNISSTNANYFFKYHNHLYKPATVLKKIMEYNGTLRIFHAIGKKDALEKKYRGFLFSDKTYLFKEYYTPKPIPSDYYEMSDILTNYQWIVFSQRGTENFYYVMSITKATKLTGYSKIRGSENWKKSSTRNKRTNLHMDPDYTDFWNTLISGHKWWIFLPPDILPRQFLCDSYCSKDGRREFFNINAWYTHVLPQLRNRTFYGSTVRNILQKPGETLYMPGHLAHAVMTLDDGVSVTENYNLISNLVDFVHGVMVGKAHNPELDNEMLWTALYNRHMDRDGRNVMRQMMRQIEYMAKVF